MLSKAKLDKLFNAPVIFLYVRVLPTGMLIFPPVSSNVLPLIVTLPNPLLGFPSWEAAVSILPTLAAKHEVMEKHRTALMAWWADKKAAAARRVAGLF